MFSILIVFVLFYRFNSLACTAQWECSSITNDYNYALCVDDECQCSSLGFDGNATVNNKCRCDSPSGVYWFNSNAYCINYDDAVSYKHDQLKDAYQMAVVDGIYQSLIWPAPVAIMQALILGQQSPISNLVASDAIGRVDPLGIFHDQDGVVEYFYGAVWSGLAKIRAVEFKKLITQDNVVYVHVRLAFENYDSTASNATMISSFNLSQSGSFTFSNGLVQSMDLIIHNLGASSPTSPGSSAFIQRACGVILSFAKCNATNDPDGFYSNITDCISFLSSISPGTPDNVYFNGNSTYCRFYHSLMAIARPTHHCPHAGKTGGGVCINHVYQTYFEMNF